MEGLPHSKPMDTDVMQYTNLEVASIYQDHHQTYPTHGLPHPSSLHSAPPSMPPFPPFPPVNALPDMLSLPQETDLRADKDAIYNHSLFPLLSLVFEKCELATCAPRVAGAGVCSSDSFSEDIDSFCKGVLSKSENPVFTDNPELDNLMIESTQVLRYHLLELEKVQDLCDNFCSRYINCLKGKMPIDLGMEDTEGESGGNRSSTSSRPIKLENIERNESNRNSRPSSTLSSGQADDTRPRSRNTPLSSASATATSSNMPEALSENGESLDNSVGSAECTDGEDDTAGESRANKRQPKRGIFPKGATNIMRAWLFQHLSHPYPSEDQKKQLALETGLTILQVNNWFINARRRIVQPMIDQSNRGANAQLMNELRPKSTESSLAFPSSSTAYPTYSSDAGMSYLDNQHMQLGRLPAMPGSDVYDPMKGAYSHMTDNTPRFDMFGMQGVPRAEMYAHPMSGAYAQINPYSPQVYPSPMMLHGQPSHHLMGLNPNPNNE